MKTNVYWEWLVLLAVLVAVTWSNANHQNDANKQINQKVKVGVLVSQPPIRRKIHKGIQDGFLAEEGYYKDKIEIEFNAEGVFKNKAATMSKHHSKQQWRLWSESQIIRSRSG